MDPSILIWLISLPFIVGAITLLIPKKVKGVREAFSIAITLFCLILSIFIFRSGEITFVRHWIPDIGINFSLRAYSFSSFLLIFINLFGVLISLYSLRYMWGKKRLPEYYAYLLFSVGASSGAALANNFILFLVFWGMVLLMLYGLLSFGSQKLAAKGLYIIGFSDFCLILGIIFLWRITGTFGMQASQVPLVGGLAVSAFILLMIGAIAKAGAMPFHTWIPDAALEAPVPVMAFMPASLDKLLGIYLLARVCLDFFRFIPNSGLSILLMAIGAFTVVAAVLMALIQHHLTKLLSYHAISQVGYMVLGIGTGIPIGIAGGVFHMVNHAIYKCCLFLTGGSAEYKVKSAEISKLGGLSRVLPIAFVTCVITALSISGVPPFNGFFSKWMVYQGIIEAGQITGMAGSKLWILWLVAAMFGSALTLASFLKVIHGTFLGRPGWKKVPGKERMQENFPMAVPEIILAGLCVLFGIFAWRVPLRLFIFPSVRQTIPPLGAWSPGLATLLIIIGVVLGGIIYLLSRVRLPREDVSFVGGELATPGMRVSGEEWYDTVKDYRGLRGVYARALKGTYDFYNWGIQFFRVVAYFVYALGDRLADYLWRGTSSIGLRISRLIKRTHTGVLTFYLLWIVVGIIILLIVLLR